MFFLHFFLITSTSYIYFEKIIKNGQKLRKNEENTYLCQLALNLITLNGTYQNPKLKFIFEFFGFLARDPKTQNPKRCFHLWVLGLWPNTPSPKLEFNSWFLGSGLTSTAGDPPAIIRPAWTFVTLPATGLRSFALALGGVSPACGVGPRWTLSPCLT